MSAVSVVGCAHPLECFEALVKLESPVSGLLLPKGVVQPFDLRSLVDDLHVIAYFEGHPRYEAVEAMVRRRAGRPPLVRAILTHHDQTQIDHLNDRHIVSELSRSGAARSAVFSDVNLEEGIAAGAPSATIKFASASGEQIVFRVQAAAPPDSARGGLTDPGRHASDSSLPIMVRARSSMAGMGTAVEIDGVAYPVPARVNRPPHFVGLHGFYTEQHEMGLVRAGMRRMTVQEPVEIELDSHWRYTTTEGESVEYRVVNKTGNGRLLIALQSNERREVITASTRGKALEVHEIECGPADRTSRGLVLHFSPAEHFAISVGSFEKVVAGTWSALAAANPSLHTFQLVPAIPAWAISRPVSVVVERRAAELSLNVSIGHGE